MPWRGPRRRPHSALRVRHRQPGDDHRHGRRASGRGLHQAAPLFPGEGRFQPGPGTGVRAHSLSRSSATRAPTRHTFPASLAHGAPSRPGPRQSVPEHRASRRRRSDELRNRIREHHCWATWRLQYFRRCWWLPGNQNAAREQAGSNPQLPERSQGAARAPYMPGRGRPFRPGQSGNPGGARAFPHKTWPLAPDILHKTILANQAAFEQKPAGSC